MLLFTAAAHAQDLQATADDGRRVTLKADGTWQEIEAQASVAGTDGAASTEIIDSADSAESETSADSTDMSERAKSTDRGEILLKLEGVKSGSSYCRAELRLYNDCNYKVRDIVFWLSVYKAGGTLIETVVAGFNSVRPSLNQVKAVKFSSVTCEQIDHVLVHGGDRCRMGDLDQFSAQKGECLSRVQVSSSTSVQFRKSETPEPTE